MSRSRPGLPRWAAIAAIAGAGLFAAADAVLESVWASGRADQALCTTITAERPRLKTNQLGGSVRANKSWADHAP